MQRHHFYSYKDYSSHYFTKRKVNSSQKFYSKFFDTFTCLLQYSHYKYLKKKHCHKLFGKLYNAHAKQCSNATLGYTEEWLMAIVADKMGHGCKLYWLLFSEIIGHMKTVFAKKVVH